MRSEGISVKHFDTNILKKLWNEFFSNRFFEEIVINYWETWEILCRLPTNFGTISENC